MGRQPTQEQLERAAERRAAMRALAARVRAMPEGERVRLARAAGVRTIEGRELSVFNQCFLMQQHETVSLVGGFRQWIRAGRCVRKGERGLALWIPTGSGKAREDAGADVDAEDAGDGRPRFMLATVFDVTQTDERGSDDV